MGEIGKEIDEMLKGLSGQTFVEEEENPDEEPEEKEDSIEESPEEEEPEEKEEPIIEEEKAPDEKDKIIEDLRRKIEEKETTIQAKEEPIVEVPLTPESQDFIGDLDPEDIVRDKDEFNKLLNAVYSKGLNDARKVVGEGVLRSIPDIVKANIEIVAKLKESSEQFYKDNEDLKPFKRVVAAVFEEIASQNPGKPYGEILKSVGPEARKRLELHRKTVEKDRDQAPRLPNKKGGLVNKHERPNTTPLQDEIAAMNKSLGV